MGAFPSDLYAGPAIQEKSFQNILKTIGGMEFVLDDEAKSLSINAPESILSKAGKKLGLESDEELFLKTDNLTLESKKQSIFKSGSKVKISLDDSAGALNVEASADIVIKSGGKIVLQGKAVEIS